MTDASSIMGNESREAAIERGLGRIEGKMDILLTQFANHALDDKANFDTIDRRMSSLERRYTWFAGVWAGIVFIGGSLYSLLHILKGNFN